MGVKAIEVSNLCKSYPKVRSYRQILARPFASESVQALNGVTLDVEPGQIFGILGPNGAGKTTLVKILTTLITPTSGEARIFGHDVARGGVEVLSRVGLVVSDERSFYWRLTVGQNLRFFGTLNDMEGRSLERRIDELLEVLGCAEYRDRPFRNLSTGIRQRVAVARALLMDPPLLLMDEPTSSMDPGSAGELRSWVRQTLVDEGGKAVLLVTHDPLEAEELCDEIAVLREGQVVHRCSPAEIRSRGADGGGWRMSVSGWNPVIRERVERAGFQVDEGVGTVPLELEVRGGEWDVGDLVGEMTRSGVQVHDCTRLQAPFVAGIAELFDGERRQ